MDQPFIELSLLDKPLDQLGAKSLVFVREEEVDHLFKELTMLDEYQDEFTGESGVR